MKEIRSLVLLTNYYPYGKGEEYIESEIAHTAEHFDRILIVSTMATRQMEQTRELPENAISVRLNLSNTLFSKILQLKSGILNIKSLNKFTQIDYNKNLKQIVYQLYFFSRVEQVYHSIIENDIVNDFLLSCNPTKTLIYSYWAHVTASVAARLKVRFFENKARFISRGHRYDLYDYCSPCGYIPDRNFMLKTVDRFYSCSWDGANHLRSLYPEFSQKIDVSMLGTIDQGLIKCSRDTPFTIVSCSAIRTVKRLDRIVDVVKILTDDGYSVKWVHLGDGPDRDKFESYAKKMLTSKAYAFEGQMTNQEVFEWYRENKVAIFINLSDSEGIPVAIMEAMSCGIPVVATNVGGTKELLAHDGLIMPLNPDSDMDVIASLIVKILEMKSESYSNLCQRTRSIWEKYANAKKNYELFYHDIEDLFYS